MPHEVARYEYRAFAPTFGIVEQRMRTAGGAPHIRESAELYLVSGEDDTHNVKIRDGQLDIKVLLQRAGDLEQWDPKFKFAFPLADRVLAEVFAPALRIAAALPADAGASVSRLVAALREAATGVVVIELFKRRSGFLVEDCIAEIADVSFDGAAIRTACVESTDPEQVRRVAARLGLDAFPNVSYLAAVRRVVGLTQTPHLEFDQRTIGT